MSCWEFPLPRLSLPKKVIIQNWRLNVVFYLAHLPILVYAFIFLIVNMGYTQEVPNNPFTLIELNPVDAEPFLAYELGNDPAAQVITFCEDSAAGTFFANCSDLESADLCNDMFGSLLNSPFSIQVTFFCTQMCTKNNNGRDPRCFLPTSALISQGSQEVQMVMGSTQEAGGTPGAKNLLHRTNPMLRDAVLSFRYSFKLAQPAPYMLGMEDAGGRRTNMDAYTAIVDSRAIVRRLFVPGEVVNYTMAEIVEAAGAVWNFTMVFEGSEFTVVTNCFTAERDLPPNLYWSGITPHQATEERPLCLMNFAWLQEKSVTYSVEGGFARTVWLRLLAETGSSFSRLPSIQSTMLNLVSLLVLLSIPPAVTGWLARSCLGSLSRIYRQATLEYFDLPMQLATAGLKAIANVATFGSLAQTTLTKEELRTCLMEVLRSAKQGLKDRDVDRLTNFVFEKDPRFPKGPTKKPKASDLPLQEADEPRVDAARFAMSSSSGDAITMQDMSHVFDSGRERGLLERLFTPAAINKALKDQRGLELPTWKKELLGVADEMAPDEILGEASETTPKVAFEPQVEAQEEPEEEESKESSILARTSEKGVEKPQPVGREALEDLLQRVKFMEESMREKADRLLSLESRNKLLVAENSELKQELGEVKQTQAQLLSRSDRQLKTVQELTELLKKKSPQAPIEEVLSQLPTSCFSASTGLKR